MKQYGILAPAMFRAAASFFFNTAWSQKTRLTERSLVRTIRVPRTYSIPSEAIRVYSSDSYLQRTISEAQQNWRNPVQ